MIHSPCSFRLSEQAYNYLCRFAAENGLSNTAAMERIICEHQKYQGRESDILAQKVTDLLEEKYKNLCTRNRLASTMADRRTDVSVEILKSSVYHLESEESNSTEIRKSAIVEDSENIVKRGVARLKQIKDNKKEGRN
mgnify:FL=1